MERTVATLGELDAEAARFLRDLAPHEAGATLITLSGELGAGKTAFVKAVAQVLGVGEMVTSPTFVLEKIYSVKPLRDHGAGDLPRATVGGFTRLVHIDAYRLEAGADVASLGFDELMKDSGNLILLEWPERVADALPPVTATLTLSANPNGSHTISYG